MKIRNFVIVGLLALAFVLSPVVANAQTVQDLQKQVAALMAQLQALISQLAILQEGGGGGGGQATTACQPGVLFDPVTGARCSDDTAGCQWGAYYNNLTGARCSDAIAGCAGGPVGFNAITGLQCTWPWPPPITPTPTTPTIAVVSPNGGESWLKGSTQTIYWVDVNKNPYYSSVNISLYDQNGHAYALKYNVPNSGQYQWSNVGVANEYKGGLDIPSGMYQVYICPANAGQKSECDLSDSYFKIYDSTQPPQSSLRVIYPNGGESLIAGQEYKILWAPQTDIPTQAGNVNIWLLDNPTRLGQIIFSNVPNDGVEYWKPQPLGYLYNPKTGQTVTPSGKYVIFIECSDHNCIVDDSDSSFAITKQGTGNLPPSISGVSGPTTLEVGKSGTWSVTASDPENGPLSYSVIWGDEVTVSTTASAGTASVQQTASFTHSYASAGTYYPTFTVTDNSGQSAKTSLSVVVGGGTTTNNPPKLEMPYPLNAYVGQELTFGLRALDDDNDKLLYGLEFGDGMGMGIIAPPNCQNGYASGQVFPVKHTYSTGGTFRVRVSVTDCHDNWDRYEWDLAVGYPATIIPTIISSNPPNGAIDATAWTGNNYETVKLNFSGPVTADIFSDLSIASSNTSLPNLTPGNFGLKDPDAIGLSFRRNGVLTHVAGERIRITHKPSGSSICLGFLPGDADQNGYLAATDIGRLNAWVGTADGLAQPLWKTDINRDGVFDAKDMTRAGELYSAPDAIRTLPACPAAIGQAPSNQSQMASTLSAMSALLQSLQQFLVR